jgi:hypothetical protein
MPVMCECNKWKKGKKELDHIVTLAWIHGFKYCGGEFIYCPWCGKKLNDAT